MVMPLVFLLLFASAPAILTPCQDDDRYRQFDFWLGSWNVYNAERELVGTNEITSAEDGCVLIERWEGRQGSTGMSINYLDPSTGTWKQSWVAATGGIVELAGGLVDDAMVMEGTLIKADGSRTPMKGRWTPLDDGRVRQQFHIPDDTETWTTWFDGYYERSDEGR